MLCEFGDPAGPASMPSLTVVIEVPGAKMTSPSSPRHQNIHSRPAPETAAWNALIREPACSCKAEDRKQVDIGHRSMKVLTWNQQTATKTRLHRARKSKYKLDCDSVLIVIRVIMMIMTMINDNIYIYILF